MVVRTNDVAIQQLPTAVSSSFLFTITTITLPFLFLHPFLSVYVHGLKDESNNVLCQGVMVQHHYTYNKGQLDDHDEDLPPSKSAVIVFIQEEKRAGLLLGALEVLSIHLHIRTVSNIKKGKNTSINLAGDPRQC